MPSVTSCSQLSGHARSFCNAQKQMTSGYGWNHSGAQDIQHFVVNPISGFLGAWNPATIMGQWAKGLSADAAGLLHAENSMVFASSRLDPTAGWFTTAYGWSIALSTIVLAVVLMVAASKLAGADDPDVLGVARASGIRAWWFIPGVTILPALIAAADNIATTVARAGGSVAASSYATMMHNYTTQVGSINSSNAVVGGSALLLLTGLLTFLSALVLILELTVVNLGTYLTAFFFPIVAAIAVNPRWKGPATKMLAMLVGLLLVKPVLFVSSAVLWHMAAAINWTGPLGQRTSVLLAVTVGSLMVALMPMAVWRFVPGQLLDIGPAGRGATGTVARTVAMAGGRPMPGSA